MAHKSLIPKQRILTESENQTSFEAWKESMVFHISLDPKSARFLDDLKTWNSTQNRGFTDDSNEVNQDKRMTKEAKAALLNIILGSISTYAPIISPRFVKNQSTSLESIWDRLRGYYGFRKTGARVLDLPQLHQDSNESREGLWERLYTFVEEILLTTNGGVKHENAQIEVDEKLTPTIQNILVAIWLNIINPALPALVQQRFSTELRNNTVYTIRDEISDSIPVLIAEMQEREGLINRAGGSNNNFRNRQRSRYQPPNKNKPSCCLCETAGRSSTNHYLSTCPFLPPSDKKYISKAREISADFEEYDSQDELDDAVAELSLNRKVSSESHSVSSIQKNERISSRRVDIVPSPVIQVSRKGKASFWTLDCGAEASLITEEECQKLKVKILPTHQRARMADGSSQLPVIGEVHFTAEYGHHNLIFSGLVVSSLDSPVLAGMPFLRQNDISIKYSTNTIILGECCSINYNDKKDCSYPSIKACASVLRVSNQTCVLPGNEIFLKLPDSLRNEQLVALEPRSTVPTSMPSWIPCNILVPNPDGEVAICNKTDEPVLISKHAQICQVRPVKELPLEQFHSLHESVPEISISAVPQGSNSSEPSTLSVISVDPSGILSVEARNKFHGLHKTYEEVFSPGIGKYNNYSGNFVHTINIGPNLPPQRRGRIPIYNQNDKEILQQKFDYLLKEGVFARAEDLNIPVEYVHPSFLVKKPSGGHRLVTSFGEVAEHARPQPTVNSNVEMVLQQIGQYKYIIKTDLCSAYYQIPLSPESSKYVGVLTPFKGTLVYKRSVMGLPGSEAALEELLSRIFGDIIKEGKMIKMCDDLYIGSESIDSLTATWEQVLDRLLKNGLKLGTDKTIICPTSTVILGWQWNNGVISPTSHRMSALAACEPPKSIKELRSFIGCYKFISRVLPYYAVSLQPLEELASNKPSNEIIDWSDELIASFNKAKKQLKNAKPIVLPRRDDQLHIITDASAAGLAATLYVSRGGKPILAGYFNCSMKKNQSNIIPCEAEALAINASIKHFSYFIVQSSKKTRVLTDSRPCVLAYRKLLRGEFSSSPKVTTFLTIASRYSVEIMHIKGVNNIFSDFASRNPIECKSKDCQFCEFVSETASSSVGEVKVADFITGVAKIPFHAKESWISIQQACPDLNKVFRYLTTGATLPKKNKHLTDVKRYISSGVSLSSNQKVIVKRLSTPFKPTSDRVVIPRDISTGLMTAIHLQLDHPSIYQLTQVFARSFFCLDMNTVAKKVVEGCHTCAALKKIPSTYHEQSTSEPAEIMGAKFAIDILRRYGQFILFIREDISSFTDGILVENEQANSLKEGILTVMSRLRTPMSPKAIIRCDPASGFRSLINDPQLSKQNLSIELGEAKNINKNPIAEKCIEEFNSEIVRFHPNGGKISSTTLAQVISNLNGRIRNNKLSAAEIWTQRDMTTGEALNLDDKQLIKAKYSQRVDSHHPSAKYKARGKEKNVDKKIQVGQLVYLYSDRSKLRSRDKYMVIGISENEVEVRKFTNNTFRQRIYKVKKSDLIVLPFPLQPLQTILPPIDNSPPTTRNKANCPRSKPKISNPRVPQPPRFHMKLRSQVEDPDSSSSESSEDSDFNPNPVNTNNDAQVQNYEMNNETSEEYESVSEESDQNQNGDEQPIPEGDETIQEVNEGHATREEVEQEDLIDQVEDEESPEIRNEKSRRPPFVVSSKRGRKKGQGNKAEKNQEEQSNAKVETGIETEESDEEVVGNSHKKANEEEKSNEEELRRSERVRNRLNTAASTSETH